MREAIDIGMVRTDSDQPVPDYARPGDAGLDLRSSIDADIAPGQRLAVPCGIRLAIPDGYAGLVVPRSGLALNHGISLVNSPGLIDSGYRGEITAVLLNTDTKETFHVSQGDRIAQLLIIGIPRVSLHETDQLDITPRGESGFGSSGL